MKIETAKSQALLVTHIQDNGGFFNIKLILPLKDKGERILYDVDIKAGDYKEALEKAQKIKDDFLYA
jgi:hypothetical protein